MGSGRQTTEGSPQGHRCHRCSPTCTSTTSSTAGPPVEGRHARGDMIVTRFADDFVVGFQHLGDAKRFLNDLRSDREVQPGAASGQDPPHRVRPLCGSEIGEERGLKSRRRSTSWASRTSVEDKDGRFWLRRITSKEDEGEAEAGENRASTTPHWPIPEQGRWLASVLRGHFDYYAVPGNIDAVSGLSGPGSSSGGSRFGAEASAPVAWERYAGRQQVAALCPHRASLSQRAPSPPGPKAGARCGSSARRDLSGGPPARAVPAGLPMNPSNNAGRRRGGGGGKGGWPGGTRSGKRVPDTEPDRRAKGARSCA